MKHSRKRNNRIAEELILLAYRYGAKDINLNIKNRESTTIIIMEASEINIEKSKLELINKLLNVPRCSEMEEYYWNLTGESDVDCELSLIGVMTDYVKVNLKNNILKIELYRNK